MITEIAENSGTSVPIIMQLAAIAGILTIILTAVLTVIIQVALRIRRERAASRRCLLYGTQSSDMRDGFIILDESDNFLEANERAIQLFPELAETKRGTPLRSVESIPRNITVRAEQEENAESEQETRRASDRRTETEEPTESKETAEKISPLLAGKFDITTETADPQTGETIYQTRQYITAATTLRFDGKRVGTGIVIIDNTDNQNLLRKYEHLPQIDEHTRLYNKNAFMTLTARDFALQRRKHTQGCLLIIDIDFLAYVNRIHGRAAGDAAVTACAQIIQTTLRKTDISGANISGDFAVWLPDTPLAGGIKAAEKIRAAAAETAIPLSGGSTGGVTLSAGIAELTACGANSLDTLAEYAEIALYAAKQSGRNRVCVWHETWRKTLAETEQKPKKPLDPSQKTPLSALADPPTSFLGANI